MHYFLDFCLLLVVRVDLLIKFGIIREPVGLNTILLPIERHHKIGKLHNPFGIITPNLEVRVFAQQLRVFDEKIKLALLHQLFRRLEFRLQLWIPFQVFVPNSESSHRQLLRGLCNNCCLNHIQKLLTGIYILICVVNWSAVSSIYLLVKKWDRLDSSRFSQINKLLLQSLLIWVDLFLIWLEGQVVLPNWIDESFIRFNLIHSFNFNIILFELNSS